MALCSYSILVPTSDFLKRCSGHVFLAYSQSSGISIIKDGVLYKFKPYVVLAMLMLYSRVAV